MESKIKYDFCRGIIYLFFSSHCRCDFPMAQTQARAFHFIFSHFQFQYFYYFKRIKKNNTKSFRMLVVTTTSCGELNASGATAINILTNEAYQKRDNQTAKEWQRRKKRSQIKFQFTRGVWLALMAVCGGGGAGGGGGGIGVNCKIEKRLSYKWMVNLCLWRHTSGNEIRCPNDNIYELRSRRRHKDTMYGI